MDVKNAEPMSFDHNCHQPPMANLRQWGWCQSLFREGRQRLACIGCFRQQTRIPKASQVFSSWKKTNSELDKEFNTALLELFNNVEAKDDEYQVSLKQTLMVLKFYQDHEVLFKKLRQAALDR